MDGIGPVVLANEIRPCGRGRPALPAHVALADRSAKPDVGVGDQNVGCLKLNDRGWRRGRRVRAACKQGSNAAGDHGNDQHDDTRGLHTNTSYDYPSTQYLITTTTQPLRPLRGPAAWISAAKGQSMVNKRYPNRVNEICRNVGRDSAGPDRSVSC